VEALACADFAVYAATKAALDGFARSLRVEWGGRIDVQVIHPGAVRTGFHDKAGVPSALVSSPRLPTAEDAAAQIERLVAGGRRTPTLGVANGLARLVGRRAGRPLDALMRRSRR
jgi:short-subunit dehydrogenase